jgi:hypothetical protein
MAVVMDGVVGSRAATATNPIKAVVLKLKEVLPDYILILEFREIIGRLREKVLAHIAFFTSSRMNNSASYFPCVAQGLSKRHILRHLIVFCFVVFQHR